MYIFLGKFIWQHAGDRIGFGNLLRFQPIPFKHIEEIRITTEVQLVRVVQPHTPVDEKTISNFF